MCGPARSAKSSKTTLDKALSEVERGDGAIILSSSTFHQTVFISILYINAAVNPCDREVDSGGIHFHNSKGSNWPAWHPEEPESRWHPTWEPAGSKTSQNLPAPPPPIKNPPPAQLLLPSEAAVVGSDVPLHPPQLPVPASTSTTTITTTIITVRRIRSHQWSPPVPCRLPPKPPTLGHNHLQYHHYQ